jgi:Xaa-Pro aminopeptidase
MNALARLRQKMEAEGVSALLVTDNLNLRWLSGFTGSSGVAVVTPDRAIFLTDSRYAIQAHEEVSDLEVQWFQSPKNQDLCLAEVFTDLGITEAWFEKTMSYAAHESLTKTHEGISWQGAPGIFAELRIIKTTEEIEKIKAACALADLAMEHVKRLLQPGVVEYDILLDLEFFLKRSKAVPSFDPIIVSGPNSARPHGKPGERALEVGDFVTIDLGAKLNGYVSDITRTFVIGEASARHEEVYNQVLKAQIACCEALIPGKTGVEVDALAREILDEKGLNQYFGHGLGHGIGLAVHDFGSLSPRSKETVAVGQVWTIEPGVYIEGWGGVRIEDDVLVTEEGPVILTHFPKELQVV